LAIGNIKHQPAGTATNRVLASRAASIGLHVIAKGFVYRQIFSRIAPEKIFSVRQTIYVVI
jgi:hypothetical protein